jgi:putative addiction module killer protein
VNENRIELLEYVTEEGTNTFRKWLDDLKDIKARAVIRVRLNRVRLGNIGDSKSVGEGVNELRINYGPGYRAYFGRSGNTIVILLCGGQKKTQEKDIQTAQRYWADYQRRK